MGCTSSTANIPESQTSTTDTKENNITFEDSGEPIKENDVTFPNSKELEQVLPEYEISMNRIQIASDDNINSTGDNFNLDNKDVQDTVHVENHRDTGHAAESPTINDTLAHQNIVVDKVMSENVDEEHRVNVTETQNVDLDRQIEEILMDTNVSEGAEIEFNEDEAKESPSPTQSEDSRATRWEALADIAAELPPSLAVDPLTGQIYSLAK